MLLCSLDLDLGYGVMLLHSKTQLPERETCTFLHADVFISELTVSAQYAILSSKETDGVKVFKTAKFDDHPLFTRGGQITEISIWVDSDKCNCISGQVSRPLQVVILMN